MASKSLQQDQGYSALEYGIGFLILVGLILLLILHIRRSSRLEGSSRPSFKVWLQQCLGRQSVEPTSDAEPLSLPNGTSPRIQEVAVMAQPNLILAPEFRSMHKHKCEMDSKVSLESRTEILAIFEKHQVQRTLQEQDFSEAADVETGHALGAFTIQLSMDENNDEDSSSSKVVSNSCAICLDTYQVGQEIAWSCNAQCQHCFHQVCITDYLVYHRLKQVVSSENNNSNNSNKAPCPCCRQDFLQQGTTNDV